MLFSKARDPIDSFTHFLGALLSIPAIILLVSKAISKEAPTAVSIFGVLVFGFSLLALYSASAIYHYVKCSALQLERLRKLDHSMIFVLISGTYTPLYLTYSKRGILLTAIIWLVALFGITLKMVWMKAPRWLSTLFYLIMGWAILFDPSIFPVLPGGLVVCLLTGGLSYTLGAVMYGFKKPNLSKLLGFHELFHLLVLLGSLLHFLGIYIYAI